MYRFYIYDCNNTTIHTSRKFDTKIEAEVHSNYYLEDNTIQLSRYSGVYAEVEPIVLV